MKKLALILLAVLIVISLPTPARAETLDTCNSFQITEIGANLQDQFIELFNCSATEQNLIGYSITTQYGSSTTSYTFQSEVLVQPGAYHALFLASATELKLTKNPTGSPRQVQLIDTGKLVVDSMSYGSQKEGLSWSLIDSVWQGAKPTPGQANIIIIDPPDEEETDPPEAPTTNPDCENLKITEIGAYPGSGKYNRQFIELSNVSTQPIDLKGCQIMTNRSKTHYFEFGDETLKPSEMRILFIDETDGLLLSKTVAGVVYVLSSDGATELDVQVYPELKAGTSWWKIGEDWQVSKQPSPGALNMLPPINYCDGIKLSEIGANIDDQFIEIVNVGDQAVSLDGCQLMTNRSTTNYFEFDNETLAPSNFRVIKISDTPLTLTKTTTGAVYIYSSDGELEVDSTAYSDLDKDTSWSLIDGEWVQTYAVTPGSSNIFQEYPTCQDGYYRNLETGRCNKVAVIAAVKACAAGYYRNELTNRCRKIATTSTLTPCKEGQERNPETNRCRNIATTISTLKPCADGYERNAETNRCRKIVASAAGQFAVEAGPPSSASGQLLLAAIGVATATAGLLLFQYKMEIGQFIRKLRTQFTAAR